MLHPRRACGFGDASGLAPKVRLVSGTQGAMEIAFIHDHSSCHERVDSAIMQRGAFLKTRFRLPGQPCAMGASTGSTSLLP
jgi:hypothetical protein